MFRECYVYVLLDPRKFYTPFYVGRGRGRRAQDHLNNEKTIRNPFKTRTIKKIRSKGLEPVIMYWSKSLTLEEAKIIEEELIIKWGRRGVEIDGILTNCIVSGTGGEGHRPETRLAFSQSRKGKLGGKHSEETKQKLSIIAQNRPLHLVESQRLRCLKSAANRKGIPLSEEHRAKIGRPQTEEMRKQKSDKMKGRPKNSNGMLGKKHSEIAIENIRAAHNDPVVRQKKSDNLKGKPWSEARRQAETFRQAKKRSMT
jgi:hypothetical protein